MQVQATVFSSNNTGQKVHWEIPDEARLDLYGNSPHGLTDSQRRARDLCLRFGASMVGSIHEAVPHDKKLGVVLTGNPGVGKTHLAKATLRHVLGHRVSPVDLRTFQARTDEGHQAVAEAQQYLLSLSQRVLEGGALGDRYAVTLAALQDALKDPSNHTKLALALLAPPHTVVESLPVPGATYDRDWGWSKSSLGVKILCGRQERMAATGLNIGEEILRALPPAVSGNFLERFGLPELATVVRDEIPNILEILYGREAIGREPISPETIIPVRTLDISAYLSSGKDNVTLLQRLAEGRDIIWDLAVNLHAFGDSIVMRDLDRVQTFPGLVIIDAAQTEALILGAKFLAEGTTRGGLVIVDDLFATEARSGKQISAKALEAFSLLVRAANDRGIRLLVTTNWQPSAITARFSPQVASRWGRLEVLSVEGNDGRQKSDGF